MRPVHEVGHPAHGRSRQRLADEGELAGARLREAVGDGEDGAVVLGDPPAAVVEALRLGQVAVLVEDGGQRGDLLVEGEVCRPGQRAGDPPLASLLEELVDLARARSAQVAEELGGEVAVALRIEGLGRRRQLVDVAGPAPTRRLAELVVVREEPVVLEVGQLQPDGGGVRARAPATAEASRGPVASAG